MSRRSGSRFGRDADERGAFLMLYALLVVVALAFAALVIDLAALRQDRAANRSAADFASTSAAVTLSNSAGQDMQAACQDAWAYLTANLANASGGGIGCSAFASVCSATAPRSTTGSTGPYTVTITNPVPDGSALLDPDALGAGSQASNVDIDGTPCERVAVSITEARSSAFAQFLGFTSNTTTSHSVARAVTGTTQGEVVALLILEPASCNALTASGQGNILVQANGDKPGAIIVDSSATGGSGSSNCNTGTRFAVDAVGTQNSRITAEPSASGDPGVIRLYALRPGQGTTHAYEASDVSSGRLSPQPTASSGPATRAPVDHRYNCKVANGCPDAPPDAPYIDTLVSQLGGAGAPGGYQTYPGPGESCSTQPSTPAITKTGNFYVNCSTLTVRNAITFQAGNVVFQGGLDVQGGTVRVNGPNDTPASDVIAFFRSGGIVKNAQGTLRMPRTLAYLANGVVTLGAGSGTVLWSAPFGGNFEDLALWSESSSTHSMGGQANLNLDGVFFMPNAQFNFTGQGTQYQVNAQFISMRLDMSGQGSLRMQPDPDRVVLIPLRGVRLIR